MSVFVPEITIDRNAVTHKVETHLQVLQPSLDFGANLRGLLLHA